MKYHTTAEAGDRRRRVRLLRGAMWAAPAVLLACDLLGPAARAGFATRRLTMAACNDDPNGVREAFAAGAHLDRAHVLPGTLLRENYENAGGRDAWGDSVPLLPFAAARCDAPTVTALLQGAPGTLSGTPEGLTTALRLAVVEDNLSAIDPLLEAGAAPTTPSRDALLRLAASGNHLGATRRLVARGLRLKPRPGERPAAMYSSRIDAERLVARVTWPGWKPAARKKAAIESSHTAEERRARAVHAEATDAPLPLLETPDWR